MQTTTPKSVLWGSVRGSATSASVGLGLSRDLLSLRGVMAKTPGASLGGPGWRERVGGWVRGWGGDGDGSSARGPSRGKTGVGGLNGAASKREKGIPPPHHLAFYRGFEERGPPKSSLPSPMDPAEGCPRAGKAGKTSDTGPDFQKPGCMPCFFSSGLFSFVLIAPMILFLVEHLFCMKPFKTALAVPSGVWEGCLGDGGGGDQEVSLVSKNCATVM